MVKTIIENRFYKEFEGEVDQLMYEFMTERGLHEAVERTICAAHGIHYSKYLNDEEEPGFDQVFNAASYLSTELMDEFIIAYAAQIKRKRKW